MKTLLIQILLLAVVLSGCGNVPAEAPSDEQTEGVPMIAEPFTAETLIRDVMADPAFGEFGRLLFPVDDG